jgi:hypothetical protein
MKTEKVVPALAIYGDDNYCDVTVAEPLFSLAPENKKGIITWPEWICSVVKETGAAGEVAFGIDDDGERVCWARRALSWH